MAVTTNPKDSKLRLRFKVGTDAKGKDVLKTKTYSKIKSIAVDEDVYAIADTIIGLQEHSIADLIRVDEKEIVEA